VQGACPLQATFFLAIAQEVFIQESPLFIKTYDFTRWLLERTNQFPKGQRFVMAKRIEDAILNFYDLLLRAVKMEKSRKEILWEASYELERVRHYLRLSKDMGLFSLKQYEYAAVGIVEIGKLLGGWLKKV